jgi:regulator of RNase E activity RraA
VDKTILQRAASIGTSTFSDVLDALGIAGVMSGIARRSGEGRVVGYARTMDCRVGPYGLYPQQDFAVFPVFQSLEPDTCLVINLGGADVSSFGGLAALTLHNRGVAGVVIDGGCRDVEELRASGLTVASRHVTPRSGRGRVSVLSQDKPVPCGNVIVRHGDLVVMDETGVAVIPAEHVDDVLGRAESIEHKDNAWAVSMRNGGGESPN